MKVSKDIHTNRMLKQKEQSRQIIKEIVNFGVSENQKFDIIYMLILTL